MLLICNEPVSFHFLSRFFTSVPAKRCSVAREATCCLDTVSFQHADSESFYSLCGRFFSKIPHLVTLTFILKLDLALRSHGECPPDKRYGNFVFENAGGPAHQSPFSFVRAGESPSVLGHRSSGQPGLRERGKGDTAKLQFGRHNANI